MVDKALDKSALMESLRLLGSRLESGTTIEILIIGGAAGMLTGLLRPDRTTEDCDVIHANPQDAMETVRGLAVAIAHERGLSEDWINLEVQQLSILPDGWRKRRILVGEFGRLIVYAAGRRDLLATKIYAHRPKDREDISDIGITRDEVSFVATYLKMLRVPSRGADLDRVQSAETYLDALKEDAK